MNQTSTAVAASMALPRSPARPVATRTSATRHFQIGVVGVSLRTRIVRVRREFERLYEPYQRQSPPRSAVEIEVLREWHPRSPRPRYRIRLFDEDYKEVWGGRELLPKLEWAVNAAILMGHTPYYIMHASVMQRGRAGFVFPGMPGSGKSTLAAALLARGWRYLCDEFALIDPTTMQLQPYPKALCIKSGGFRLCKSLGLPLNTRKRYVKALKGKVCFLSPHRIRPDAVGKPCPIRAVILPQYEAGAAPELAQISRVECAFLLNDQSFNFYRFGDRGVDLLAGIVREAECYRLRSGDIRRTCDLIEDLASRLA